MVYNLGWAYIYIYIFQNYLLFVSVTNLYLIFKYLYLNKKKVNFPNFYLNEKKSR